MKNPFASFGSQWIAKTVTLAVIVAGGATVAVSNLPEPADHVVAHLPAKDAATWAMPLDRYVIVSFGKRDYAEDLLVAKCLSGRGIDWPVPWQDVDQYRGDAQSQTPRPLSGAAASERGYHGQAEDEFSTYLWHRFVAASALPKSQQATEDACLAQVRATRLSTAAVSGRNQVASTRAVELAGLAYTRALRDPRVTDAAARWRSCLAPAAAEARVGALPADPSGMPSIGVRQLFGTDVASGRVTSAEKRLATADAACQTSSGYRRALYTAEYRLQSRVTADDARILAAATADQPAFDRRLDRIVAENLPAKPGS